MNFLLNLRLNWEGDIFQCDSTRPLRRRDQLMFCKYHYVYIVELFFTQPK